MKENRKHFNNKTGYKGIYYDRFRDKYAAEIWIDGVKKRLGRFKTSIEAAKAYDSAAIYFFGMETFLNFPDAATERFKCSDGVRCVNGHDFKIYGRIDTRGYRICRKCNADAAKRYKKTRKKC